MPREWVEVVVDFEWTQLGGIEPKQEVGEVGV